jgi:hypothetical protein
VTTLTDFVPSQSAPFQFQPTLDGQVYSAVVTWNLFGRRFYLNLSSLDGTLVVCKALVGSPDGSDIDLVGGLFTTSTLVFRQSTQQFEVNP